MKKLTPRQQRGVFALKPDIYGHSVYGAPLLCFPAQCDIANAGIIMAGTHGDETASIAALSCALRSIAPDTLRQHVILSVNPDGNQLGTRGNANGVDLNRSFPTSNWVDTGTVYRWNTYAKERDVVLSSGNKEVMEPETEALVTLIQTLQPKFAVTLHEPLACIDVTRETPLAQYLAQLFSLPIENGVGYATPGSFGTWCDEQSLPCITLEFPPISADDASECYLDALIHLLSGELQ